MQQGDNAQYNLLMTVARSNHLYAQFLLGWLALPASEARIKEALDILQAAVHAGDRVEADLLKLFRETLQKDE